MKLIKLASEKGFAKVDDLDFANLNQYKWYLSKIGYVCHSHYINGKRVLWYIHKQILNPNPGFFCDHINRDKTDNQRSNLRICTFSQNNANRVQSNKTGFKGLGWHNRNQRWQVYLKKNGKPYYGGQFKTIKEAAQKYNELALKLHGSFAILNNVEELN